MVDVKRLFEYNENIRRKYFDCLAKLPWAEFTKNREASFHSMRNIFVHTLGATDYWLDFLQKEKLHSEKKFDEYKTFDDVRAYMKQVDKRTKRYFDSPPSGGLSKKYTMEGDNNQTVEVTAEDVLIHMFEEEVHHRGELIALLWQIGVDPPSMGWKDL